MKTVTVLILIPILLCHSFAKAQQQFLDSSFNDDGIAITQLGYVENIAGIIIQSDNKIIVGGSFINSNGFLSMGVVRYSQAGVLDSSFGINGITSIFVNGSDEDRCISMCLQPDGKILLVGSAYYSINIKMMTVRLNTDGSLDTSYDGDGIQLTDFGWSTECQAYSILVQTDNKIIIGGESVLYNGMEGFSIIRYNTNGSLDTTFGINGKVFTDSDTSNDFGRKLALQADGKIILSGYKSPVERLLSRRYLQSGEIDSSYGVNGKVETQINFYNRTNTSCLQTNQSLLVGGWSADSSSYPNNLTLLRYDIDGNIDLSFGDSGKVISYLGSNSELMSIIQEVNKILVTGSICDGVDCDFLLESFNLDGSLDYLFGDSGKMIFSPTIYSNVGYSMAIQNDTKILIAGKSYMSSNDAVVVLRIDPDKNNGVNDLESVTDDYLIYPNPTNDFINIPIEGMKNILITNLTGQICKEIKTDLKKIPVADLSTGIYFLKIQMQNGNIFRRKFVKE